MKNAELVTKSTVSATLLSTKPEANNVRLPSTLSRTLWYVCTLVYCKLCNGTDSTGYTVTLLNYKWLKDFFVSTAT